MIEYTDGYRYQLQSDATFSLPAEFRPHTFSNRFITLQDGILTIRAGYAWDGASGPTIDTKTAMRGPLAHDALYQAMREGLLPRALKPEADQFMHDTMIEDGMMRIRAWLWLLGVRKCGLMSTIANKDIKRAP